MYKYFRGVITMQKFEYKIIRIKGTGENAIRTLNELGQQGWELVQVVWGSWHYFKRLVE